MEGHQYAFPIGIYSDRIYWNIFPVYFIEDIFSEYMEGYIWIPFRLSEKIRGREVKIKF